MAPLTDPTLLATIAILVVLVAGATAAVARRATDRAHERDLSEAIGLLRIHCDAMRRLDDDDMPEDLLQLVVDLSHLLHDPEVCAVVRHVMDKKRAGEMPELDTAAEPAGGTKIQDLVKSRPDLALAVMQALVSGLLAFEKRWPEYEGEFAPGVKSIIAAPVEEAQRIVRAAGSVSKSWAAAPIGAAA